MAKTRKISLRISKGKLGENVSDIQMAGRILRDEAKGLKPKCRKISDREGGRDHEYSYEKPRKRKIKNW